MAFLSLQSRKMTLTTFPVILTKFEMSVNFLNINFGSHIQLSFLGWVYITQDVHICMVSSVFFCEGGEGGCCCLFLFLRNVCQFQTNFINSQFEHFPQNHWFGSFFKIYLKINDWVISAKFLQNSASWGFWLQSEIYTSIFSVKGMPIYCLWSDFDNIEILTLKS